MHPSITSERPGICPICNMKLVKKDSGETHDHEGHTHTVGTEEQKIEISPAKQKWLGVETSNVIRKDFSKNLKFAGTVTYDPELFTALTEYREISRQRNMEGMESSHQLRSMAYNRLLQMGLSSEGIQFLLNRDPSELVTGARNGTALIYTQVYEAEISSIKPGLSVKLICPSYPGEDFFGTVKAVDTILNADTRTMKARIIVKDPKSLLKPQMLVETEINVQTKNVLAVPSVAIMHTGLRSIVYKKMGENHFLPVEVLAGKEAEDFTEIIRGLEEGEEVVTKANFLIDSESKIKFGDMKIHSHDK